MAAVVVTLSVVPLVTCCYEDCTQKFSRDMETISQSVNNSDMLSADFCRAMSSQMGCLNAALGRCTPQQRALIESLLTVFIQPDYRRTCTGGNATSEQDVTTNIIPSTTNPVTPNFAGDGFLGANLPVIGGSRFVGIVPTSGRTLVICRQKFQNCQVDFNKTFSDSVTKFNISGLCQSLKQYTICFLNLLSSECGHLVPRDLVYNMQTHYGGMCSNDAQANSHTMIECANLTMTCFVHFNSSFGPAVGDYNLKIMCSALDNYTTCMQEVSHTDQCSQFITHSLAGIKQMRMKHSAYCGEDNGHTAMQCVEGFQDCHGPFNLTFFPGLHTANLTLICGALSTYASCVSHLTPTCSQQFGQILQSVQTLKSQFAQKCHPNMIKLASCRQVGQCSNIFLQSYSLGVPSNSGLCGSIGDYFPCVEKSLDACHLPQSTTQVAFGGLGVIMKGYCHKVSRNVNLGRCPAFVKCTAAIWMSFSPSTRNLYEGSTWCTFLQLSIGCAEHALQSLGCSLEADGDLQQNIRELDQLRVRTCEKEKDVGSEENLVDPGYLKAVESKDKNSTSGTHNSASVLRATIILLTLTSAAVSLRFII